MRGWTKVAGGLIGVALIGAGVAVPLETVDSPGAAIASYADSVAQSSGGQVQLAAARVVELAPGRASYALVWRRPDRNLAVVTVVQRRTYVGGILASWQVVDSGSALATASR